MKQITLIGIGNCGSQTVALAEEKYPELFDCVYINTSESDLGMVNSESLKIKIGENDEVYGSGKNRNKMKAFLREDIKKVLTKNELPKTKPTIREMTLPFFFIRSPMYL